jgi:hypothetical protein
MPAEIKTEPSSCTGRVWVLFLRHAHEEGTSSHNSALLHHFCCRNCDPYLSYVDANAADLLRFLPMTHTCPFTVQVEPLVLFEIVQFSNNFFRFFFSNQVPSTSSL